MKKISRLAIRKKVVSNVLASLRMEQLVPSPHVISGLRTCLSGNETTEKLLAEVMSRHVTVRRV